LQIQFEDTRMQPAAISSCTIAKIPEFSGKLVFVPAGILVVLTVTLNKAQCLFPSLIRD